jgi:hypothetical protein
MTYDIQTIPGENTDEGFVYVPHVVLRFFPAGKGDVCLFDIFAGGDHPATGGFL